MLIASFLLSLWTVLFPPAVATPGNGAPGPNNASTKTTETNSTEKLTWSNTRRLTWDDFKGTPEESSPHHALTAANLAVDAKCSSNAFSYDVKCVFLLNDSWSKNKKSQSLLRHEQLHFDLTEVHARLLRKKLRDLGSSCSNLKGNLNLTVKTAFQDWKAEQDLFDKSSSHGLNKAEEAAWAEYIDKRLNELQAYK